MRSPILSLALAFVVVVGIPARSAVAQSARQDTVTVDEPTEAVVKGALKYLASKQTASGAWGASGEEKQRQVAMTGYVLMAFLSAGHLPGEGEFGKAVAQGMQFLLDSMGPDGVMGTRHDGQYMYAHGIASVALAEIYGQTRSPVMRAKLDRAIKLIISSQNPEGGWRYRPIVKDADISVTVLIELFDSLFCMFLCCFRAAVVTAWTAVLALVHAKKYVLLEIQIISHLGSWC